MKQVITLFTVLLFSLSSSAQSGTDLEFSRVISLETNSSSGISDWEEVPNGKVWKLTGVGCNYNNASSCHLELDNTNSKRITLKSSNNDTEEWETALPLFFNEGRTLRLVAGASNSQFDYGYASFIEYTVIP